MNRLILAAAALAVLAHGRLPVVMVVIGAAITGWMLA